LPEVHYFSGFSEKLSGPDSFASGISRERKIKPAKFAQAQIDQVIRRLKSLAANGLGIGAAIQTARTAGREMPRGGVGGILG
jgi:hypothetical protein